MIRGIDTSPYQSAPAVREIDWPDVVTDNIVFGAMKASQGFTAYDSFARQWKGSHDVGILRTPYHFFQPGKPVEQADFFLKLVDKQGSALFPDLPYLSDFEGSDATEGVQPDVLCRDEVDFLERIERATNIIPMLYCGHGWMTKMEQGSPRLGLKPASSELIDKLRTYVAWVAAYTTAPEPPNLLADKPWIARGFGGHEWMFWQQSGSGTVKGIHNHVDISVFSGSMDELKSLLTGTVPAGQ